MKKNIDLNKVSDLIALKESLSKNIDKKIEQAKINESISKLSSYSFGVLDQVFNGVLDRIYESKVGKSQLSKYVKLIKENKAMNTLHHIYKAIEKPSINENTNLNAIAISQLCGNIDRKKLNEGKVVLAKIVSRSINEAGITSEEVNILLNENKELHDSIEFLINNSKNVSKLNESIKKLQVISEEISKNECQTIAESQKSNKELMNDLNNLMESSEHTSWENRVIKDLALSDLSNGSKEELFEQYKNDCISKIDSICEGKEVGEVSRFFAMKEKLNEKKFNEETLVDDLLKLSELNETLISE